MLEERQFQDRKVLHRRVHMANERTFLAWMRTSIGIMAFGFVVERFGLFLRQMSCLAGKALPEGGAGASAIMGMVVIGLGAAMGVLSFIRFKKVERQIDNDTFQPSMLLDILLTISVTVIAAFVMLYLVLRA